MRSTQQWQNEKLGLDMGRNMKWVAVGANDAARSLTRFADTIRAITVRRENQ